VIDNNLPWGTSGSTACSRGEYPVTGTAFLWSDDIPDNDSQATVLIPDGATATIDRGTFIAAGDGVIGIRPATPKEGVAVTLEFADGHTSHLALILPRVGIGRRVGHSGSPSCRSTVVR